MTQSLYLGWVHACSNGIGSTCTPELFDTSHTQCRERFLQCQEDRARWTPCHQTVRDMYVNKASTGQIFVSEARRKNTRKPSLSASFLMPRKYSSTLWSSCTVTALLLNTIPDLGAMSDGRSMTLRASSVMAFSRKSCSSKAKFSGQVWKRWSKVFEGIVPVRWRGAFVSTLVRPLTSCRSWSETKLEWPTTRSKQDNAARKCCKPRPGQRDFWLSRVKYKLSKSRVKHFKSKEDTPQNWRNRRIWRL